MSPDPSVLHMSFAICHWKRTAKRKRPDFSLSFPPPLPSPLKSRARFEDPACVILFYFFFLLLLLPYHPLSFSSLSLPSLHHLSPRPHARLMIEISQGVRDLSQLEPLAPFVWPRKCRRADEDSNAAAEQSCSEKAVLNLPIPPPAPGWFLTFSLALITRC